MKIDPGTAARALEAVLLAYHRGLFDGATTRRWARRVRDELDGGAPTEALEMVIELGPRDCLRLPHDRFAFGRGLDAEAELYLQASLVEHGAARPLDSLALGSHAPAHDGLDPEELGARCQEFLRRGTPARAAAAARRFLATSPPHLELVGREQGRPVDGAA